jgi:hypothetical protein
MAGSMNLHVFTLEISSVRESEVAIIAHLNTAFVALTNQPSLLPLNEALFLGIQRLALLRGDGIRCVFQTDRPLARWQLAYYTLIAQDLFCALERRGYEVRYTKGV